VKPGDGVVFDSGHPEEKEEGGRVYQVQSSKFKAQKAPGTGIKFGKDAIDFARIHVGDKVWKTSDPELDRRLQQTFAGNQPHFQRPVNFEVHGCVGRSLTVLARDELGNMAQAASQMPLAEARQHPFTVQILREQLGRLGGTPFKLGELRNHLEGTVILPMSELNRLRRELVGKLEMLRAQPKRWTLMERGLPSAECAHAGTPHAARRTHLIVLVRNLAQLEAALTCGVETVYCEF